MISQTLYRIVTNKLFINQICFFSLNIIIIYNILFFTKILKLKNPIYLLIIFILETSLSPSTLLDNSKKVDGKR